MKTLLTGLAPTAAELSIVCADQSALPSLIADWVATPQYDEKMLSFFAGAFQQSEITWQELIPQFNKMSNPPFQKNQPQFTENLAQSFARTAAELVREGQPFTATMTTSRFMMTPALMAAYALLDTTPITDAQVGTTLNGQPPIDLIPHDVKLESDRPIPIEESLDPGNTNYMTFYEPELATIPKPDCASGVLPPPVRTIDLAYFLLNGSTMGVMNGAGTFCYPPPHPPTPASYLRATDFSTWRMVNIRQPRAGEKTSAFYDLPQLRAANELVLNIPRVGFFTTLSFLGQWSTNKSNLARVTGNQTLIVALGKPIDLTNKTEPPSLGALDTHHAEPGTDCYDCHRSLDPVRQFFRQTYTLAFSLQADSAMTSLPGQFGFHKVSASGKNIFDLGTLLAQHPLFATAWVQKLCTWANSAPCTEDDPEFMRLVSLFISSQYSWKTLVNALFASPIVTNLKPSKNADMNGEVFPVARQAHLCALLTNRLRVPDACGLAPGAGGSPDLQVVRQIAASWPSDAYGRGNPTPVLANTPGAFTRGGMENICTALALHLIDNRNTGRFKSTDPTHAIQGFVTTLMGLESDRGPPALKLLRKHFSAARKAGATASDALKSTFVVACLSPYVVGVGI